MSNRLTRIYTRGGDKGETSLANGHRVSKASIRVEVLGAVDELNCALGVLDAHLRYEREVVHPFVREIQNRLFDIGGELAVADSGYVVIQEAMVEALERELDQLNEQLSPLKEFILPGGNTAAAHCHMARAICRRAERLFVALQESEAINPEAMRFLNRLSDYLFVYARSLANEDGACEVFWQKSY